MSPFLAGAVSSWQRFTTSYKHISSHHITSQPAISHKHIALHHIPSQSIPSHPIVLNRITSHNITSHHITSSHLVSSHLEPNHMTSYHIITAHHITTTNTPREHNQPLLKQHQQTDLLIASPYKKFVLGGALVGGAAHILSNSFFGGNFRARLAWVLLLLYPLR